MQIANRSSRREQSRSAGTRRMASAAIAVIGGLWASHSVMATVYTWSPVNSTDNWSTGLASGNWNANPISGTGNELTFVAPNSSVIPAGTYTSTDDISGGFSLLTLDLQGMGPATGSATVNVSVSSGNFLNFDANANINLNANAGTGGGLTYNVYAPMTFNTAGSGTTDSFNVNGNATFVMLGTWTGGINLTKNGSGTLVLANTNNNGSGSRTFTISNGKVQIQGPGSLGGGGGMGLKMTGGVFDLNGTNQSVGTMFGSTGGKILNDGTGTSTITIGQGFTPGDGVNGEVTVFADNDNAGTGKLALTRTGSNSATLQLGAVNTYTGLTTVTNGTIQLVGLNGSIASGNAVTTGGSGTFDINGRAQVLGNVTNGGIVTSSTSGGALTIGNGSSGSGVYSGTMTLTIASGATATLGGTNTYTGNTTFNSGTLNLNNAAALGNTANTFLLNGGTIDDTNTALTLSTYAQTWGGDFAFTGTKNLNLGTGAVSLGTGVGTTRTLTVNGGVLTVGGVISNGTTVNSLTKAGAGQLVLSGTNLYTGATTITAGTLSSANTQALGTTAAVVMTGGTFDASGVTMTIGSLTGTGGAVNLGSNTLTIGADNTSPAAYAGVISGGGGIAKTGTGTLTLSGANAYTGDTNVNAGILDAQNNTAIGTGGNFVFVNNNGVTGGTLQLDGGITNSKIIHIAGAGATGTSGALVNGSGTNTLSGELHVEGANSGATTIGSDVGTLNITGVFDGGGNNLTFTGSGNGTLSGSIFAAGAIFKTGTGQWNFYGSSVTRTNSIHVESGVFGFNDLIGSADFNFGGGIAQYAVGSTVDISGSIEYPDNNAAVKIDTNGNNVTWSHLINGNNNEHYGFIKYGAGTLNLAVANTYTGGTTVTGGQLSVNNTTGSATGPDGLTIQAGATLGGGNGAADGGTIANGNYNAGAKGIVTGNTTIQTGGHLAPGNSVGTLTLGSLELQDASVLDYEFNGTANDFTQATNVTADGTVGVNLYLEGSNAAYGVGGTYQLIGHSGSFVGNINNFYVMNPLASYSYTFTDTGTAIDLVVATPEPASLSLIVMGALPLLSRRRRRVAKSA